MKGPVETDKPSFGMRAAMVVVSFPLIGLVGFVDARTSPYIAFGIFYLIPICLATWFGGRSAGLLAAVASAGTAFVVDMWSFAAGRPETYSNLGLRLALYLLVATMLSHIRDSMGREKRLAEQERQAARRLEEVNRIKDELMRSVAEDVREPLSEIYAKVVTLGFEIGSLSETESREALSAIADASHRLSGVVHQLLPEDARASTTTLAGR